MVNLQPSIFVSYAHEDADLAHAFAAALEREGPESGWTRASC